MHIRSSFSTAVSARNSLKSIFRTLKSIFVPPELVRSLKPGGGRCWYSSKFRIFEAVSTATPVTCSAAFRLASTPNQGSGCMESNMSICLIQDHCTIIESPTRSHCVLGLSRHVKLPRRHAHTLVKICQLLLPHRHGKCCVSNVPLTMPPTAHFQYPIIPTVHAPKYHDPPMRRPL
jgi:hypothetical protein